MLTGIILLSWNPAYLIESGMKGIKVNKVYLISPEAVMPRPTGISTIVQVRFLQRARRTVCPSWADFCTYHLCLACGSTVTVVSCLACCTFRGTRTLSEKATSNQVKQNGKTHVKSTWENQLSQMTCFSANSCILIIKTCYIYKLKVNITE